MKCAAKDRGQLRNGTLWMGLLVVGLTITVYACDRGDGSAADPLEASTASTAAEGSAEQAAATEPGSTASDEATAPQNAAPSTQRATGAASQPSGEAPPPAANTARPSDAAIAERVEASRARLSDSEAGRIVWEAIEAAGGLDRWFSNGPIVFRFNYRPVEEREPIDTIQLVDTWSSRAVHKLALSPDVRFGWTGEQAWIEPEGAQLPTNARFWALTPYYFIGIPFVLADEGVNLALEEPDELEGETYDVVKATFDDGTGDAPDDYYVAYIDQEDRRVRAVRYVVSYPGFFPEGGHTPEKLMTYDGTQEVEGIVLPETFRTFSWDGNEIGEVVTNTTLSEVSFEPDTPVSEFAIPPSAGIQEEL